MKKFTFRLLLTSTMVLASLPYSLSPAFAFSMSELEAGTIDVQLVDKGKSKGVRATAIIKAPPATVWKGITSYSDYPKYMPRVVESKVIKQSGTTFDVRIKLDTPWPMSNTWYTNRYKQDKANFKITWTMVDGSIKHNEGSWQLKPYKGKYTFATYDVIADLGIPLIPQWVVDEVSKRTVPDIFGGIKKYIGVS